MSYLKLFTINQVTIVINTVYIKSNYNKLAIEGNNRCKSQIVRCRPGSTDRA